MFGRVVATEIKSLKVDILQEMTSQFQIRMKREELILAQNSATNMLLERIAKALEARND